MVISPLYYAYKGIPMSHFNKKLYILLVFVCSTLISPCIADLSKCKKITKNFKIRKNLEVEKLSNKLDLLYGDYYLSLSKESKKALSNYFNWGFKEINKCLREVSCSNDFLFLKVRPIDTAFSLVPNIELDEMFVYRGHNYLPKNAMSVGFSFDDKAYSSTSIDFKVAQKFAKELSPHTIDLIKLSPALISGSIWLAPLTALLEKEILLPRDVQFSVIQAETCAKINYRILEAF